MKVLTEDSIRRKFNGKNYLKIESIRILYEIFNVKMMNDLDIQAFFYLLKKSSEDLGCPIEEVIENDED